MDRLRLREQERRRAAGLLGGEPLEGRRLGTGGVVDVHPGGVGGDLDLQRPAEELHLVAELEAGRGLAAVQGDPSDVEIARVEHQPGGDVRTVRTVRTVEAQAGAAGELALGEIDREVELQMLDRDLLGAREGMGVRPLRLGLDRGRLGRLGNGRLDGDRRRRRRRGCRARRRWTGSGRNRPRRSAAGAGGEEGEGEEDGQAEMLHRGFDLGGREQRKRRGKSGALGLWWSATSTPIPFS